MAYKVQILGTQLNITADIPQETLERVIAEVERMALELYELTQETNRATLFLLVALNLALELDEIRMGSREISRLAKDLIFEIQHVLKDDRHTPLIHPSEKARDENPTGR